MERDLPDRSIPVAQRTGAERFLAPSAKSTSAGLALALVLAGLLLGGCGGDDPSAGTGDGESTASSAAAAQEDTASPERAGDKEQGAAEKQSAAPKASSGPAAQSGQKHGPPIAQPEGEREQAPSANEIAEATVTDITLSSPSVPPGAGGPAPLPATYTCDGKGEWPALSWSGVPTDSAELILYAMNLAPVAGKLFVDWAVAGIDPALTGLAAGELPRGAVIGTNSFGKRGYEICPEGSETYVFAVYALPRSLSPGPGFDARELRKQILDVSGNVGLLPVAYVR
jgi:phosphatidylethanolamine-binding protein (PEBP) family uncharacterized protein